MINSTFYYCWEKKTKHMCLHGPRSRLIQYAHYFHYVTAELLRAGGLHHDEASRPWKRFQNGGSLNRKTVFPALTVYLRSFRTSLLVMLWVRLKNEQGPLIRYVSFLLRSVLKQRAFQDVLQRIIQGVSCCHFSWVDLLSVTFFLLGLDKAEKDPYKGWKTNCFQGDSPENEYVSASNRKI